MTSHPAQLRFRKTERALHIEFESGEVFDIPFQLLRIESPSAEVKGHGGDKPPPVLDKESVGVTGAEPVGHYAVRIIFDDGHDSGLFTWEKLMDLGRNQMRYLEAYTQRVAEFHQSA